MRLTPKRDGNPKGLLLALLAVAAMAEASERPLFLALEAADGLVMGALFYHPIWALGPHGGPGIGSP